MEIFKQLMRDAKYALRSRSRDLTFETIGKAKMARNLKAIEHDEYMALNKMLAKDGINNPEAGLE